MKRLPSPLLLLLAAASLAGCAAQDNFPSLAPRAAERGLAGGGSAPAPCPVPGEPAAAPIARAIAPAPSDPQLRARVAELIGMARAGQAEFAALLPRAEQAVAAAGTAESDAWVEAQQEVSRLSAARARTTDALAELDTLRLRGEAEGRANEADLRAVLEAEDEARSLAERQSDALDRLFGLLGEP